jgi:hypothetical protein
MASPASRMAASSDVTGSDQAGADVRKNKAAMQ